MNILEFIIDYNNDKFWSQWSQPLFITAGCNDCHLGDILCVVYSKASDCEKASEWKKHLCLIQRTIHKIILYIAEEFFQYFWAFIDSSLWFNREKS